MSSLVAILGLGFLLGIRHAADPDHVIAVTTLVARYHSARRAALVGLAWGVGHTFTILVVGAGIILLGWVIPVRLALSLEFTVGLMLIGLGLVTLRGAFTARRQASAALPGAHPPSPVHRHGDYIHTHVHHAGPEAHPHPADRTPLTWLDRRLGTGRPYLLVRPLIVGMVHGLAGSAAVALLVVATVPDPTWSLLYLILFGAGTIIGMLVITLALAMPFAWADGRFAWLNHKLRIASGVVSVVFGLFLAWRIGAVHGLFGPSPWLAQ